MNKNNNAIILPHVFVVGNEKGGAGKTTCSMHLTAILMEAGLNVASMDTDSRQHSFTRYMENRKNFKTNNPEIDLKIPNHYLIKQSKATNIAEQEAEEKGLFEAAFEEATRTADVIIIDTPGSYCFLSRLAHSYADTVITPINDSFLDIDVIAKIDPSNLTMISPSIYSEMVWQQKMAKAQRTGRSIEWVIVRNRLSNISTKNKTQISDVIDTLSKRISLRVAPGFSERVVFREMFLEGLTLLDLIKTQPIKKLTSSHLAARQELREFAQFINLDQILKAKEERLANESA
ncbi:MAG: division plane positioning ATPase MipZ [Rickettsiaceae bacterium]|nr:division plane positioning ATPase MipZ [Rickettsiaceae bacterium]